MHDGDDNSSAIKAQVVLAKSIRRGIIGVIFLVIVIIALTGIYTLDEEHDGVITTFGQPSVETEAGLHFKIPVVQKLTKVDTTTKGMAIGYDIETNEDILGDSIMISSDYNFLNVDFYLTYKITNAQQYVFASDRPEEILKSAAQNCIRTVIASYRVDSVLTVGKAEIQANINSMLVEKMDELNIGITVLGVTIQDSEPPTDSVVAAFKAVETAKQGKETAINNANKYRNEQLPQAEANVDLILQEAEAKKAERIAEANGQAARFNQMYAEYKKYPLITKERMFYETMEEVLPNLKIVIQGSNGNDVNTILPLDKFADYGTSDSQASTDNTTTENSAE